MTSAAALEEAELLCTVISDTVTWVQVRYGPAQSGPTLFGPAQLGPAQSGPVTIGPLNNLAYKQSGP